MRETEITKILTTEFISGGMDLESASKVANEIVLDVAKDISETADTEFNNSDVIMAVGRVLVKRLGIKEG